MGVERKRKEEKTESLSFSSPRAILMGGREMTYSKFRCFFVFSIAFLFLAAPQVLLADNALVLPKGVSSLGVTFYNYFDITQVYDGSGDAVDLGAFYNRSLDSMVFPDLQALDPFVPDGTATLGDAVVDFTREYRWWEIYYSYGVTSKLSLGVLIPYNFTRNNISAVMDTSTSDVGANPAYTLAGFDPLDPATYPVIPVAFGGQPLDIHDVFSLLGPGLDVDGNGSIEGPEPAGYGYDAIKDWSGSDLGDIEILAKYQVYNASPWRMALTGGLRLPTGTTDDPDNIMDVAPGDGQTDIILKLHTDFTGFRKLFLNATLEFDFQLPDETTLRVPIDPAIPLTPFKEKVDRDLGDIVNLELFGSYSINRDWSIGLEYKYTRKFKDEVDGDEGLAYSSLEQDSDFTSHMGILSVGYSTVQKFLDKEAAIPFNVTVAYRNRFAGTNGQTRSEYISLDFGVYF